MGRAKGIVDIDFTEGGKLPGELRIVLLLFCMEAEVLEQEDLSWLERLCLSLNLRTNTIWRHLDGPTQEFAQALCCRGQAIFLIRLSLWSAKVGHEDDSRSVLQQVLYGGKRCADARIVRNMLFCIERHIEIDAHQRTLPGNIDITDGFLVHSCLLPLAACRREANANSSVMVDYVHEKNLQNRGL